MATSGLSNSQQLNPYPQSQFLDGNTNRPTRAWQQFFLNLLNFSSATTATAGSATLPANPVGFINVTVNGKAYKIPYYNVQEFVMARGDSPNEYLDLATGQWTTTPPASPNPPMSSYEAAYAALSPELKARVASGELQIDPISEIVGPGHDRHSEDVGIRGFLSPGPNNTMLIYDLSGKVTGSYDRSGGGFLGQLSTSLANLDSSLGLSKLAPLAIAAGIDYATGGAASGALSGLFGGAAAAPEIAAGTAGTTAAMGGGFGAGLSAADIAAADLAAYPTAGIVGSIPAAAGAANTIAATTPLASLVVPATDAASASAGLTSAPAATGLTSPAATSLAAPATDAASGAAGLTTAPSGAGLTTGAGTTGLSAVTNPSLAANAPLAAGTTAAAGMGGGTGLTAISNMGAAAGAPLAAAGASGLTSAAAGGGTVGADGVVNPVGPSVTSNGVTGAATGSSLSPSLLQQLQTATGLSGTQLASLLQGGIGAINSSNISNAIGAGVDAQAAANAQSQGVLKDVYNTQLGFQQPYQAAGTNAVNALNTAQPYLTHQFDATDLQKGLAPNYDFMLQQGQMANQRAANVGGGALSGNTLQGLQNYTQNYAGNAYQNAFNNYQTQRNNIFNNLSDIAKIGQTANTAAGTAAGNYGTGVVGLNTGLANVRAAGALGQAQAGATGLSGVGNSVLLSTLLNQNNPITTPKP